MPQAIRVIDDHGELAGLTDDDHTQYQKESEKGAANGYASLDASTLVPATQLPGGSVTNHVAAADPHTGYRLETADHSHQSTGAQAGTLDAAAIAAGTVATARLGTGTPDGTKFLRDDSTWVTPGGGGALTRAGGNTTEATTTSTTEANLISLTGLSVAATAPVVVLANFRKTNGGAYTADIGLKVNATQVQASLVATSGTNRAEDGAGYWYVPPRVADYVQGGWSLFNGQLIPGGANAIRQMNNADLPTVTVTALVITGKVGNAAITLGVDEIHAYTLATS